MNTAPSMQPQGRRTLTLKPKPAKALGPKLIRWLTTPASTQLSEEAQRLLRSIAPHEKGPYLNAAADLAQMGWSADDLATVAHAVQNRRILAFQSGSITDLGEGGRPYDGATNGSKTYEGEPR